MGNRIMTGLPLVSANAYQNTRNPSQNTQKSAMKMYIGVNQRYCTVSPPPVSAMTTLRGFPTFGRGRTAGAASSGASSKRKTLLQVRHLASPVSSATSSAATGTRQDGQRIFIAEQGYARILPPSTGISSEPFCTRLPSGVRRPYPKFNSPATPVALISANPNSSTKSTSICNRGRGTSTDSEIVLDVT